ELVERRRVTHARGPHEGLRPHRGPGRVHRGAPGRARASRDRPPGPLRERRAHRALRGDDARGERAAPRVPLSTSSSAGVHLPVPLATRLTGVLGQPLRAAQRDQRLSGPSPAAPPHHPGRGHTEGAVDRSRSVRRSTLPAGVRGNASTYSTSRGYSCWLSRVLTNSWISRAKSGPRRGGTMNALATRPRRSSAPPTTAAPRTPGCLSRLSSSSTALIVHPAEMMTSSERPA